MSEQKELGRATAGITLDTYGHLFPDELDALAGRLEDVCAEALASLARTSTDQRLCRSGKALVSDRSFGVPEEGLEPSCPVGPTLLRRGCLPIPALRR
jgi:hypothetical protein